MSVVEEMFCLLRNEIDGQALPDNIEYDAEKLITLSKKHDLAHLISDALIRNGLITDSYKDFRKIRREKLLAIYRETHISIAAKEIKDALSSAGIGYVPLKGLIVRDLYPEPWMRTSCDIDVLVKADELESAVKALENKVFTTNGAVHYHDVDLYKDKTHLELHHSICEDTPQIDGELSRVWEFVKPINEYEYREENEFFVFHHIAHMFYHFVGGGCGIRPFIDFLLMKKKGFFDETKVRAFTEKCSIEKFYDMVEKMCRVWFENEPHDAFTEKIEKYVLENGVYGTSETSNRSGVIKHKSKKRYVFRLIFPSYRDMCINYKVLKRLPILLPLFYVIRGFKKAFGKDGKKNKDKMRTIIDQRDEQISEMRTMFEAIGYSESKK